jgi:hypothetical protein
MPDQASLQPTLPPLPPFPADGLSDGVIREAGEPTSYAVVSVATDALLGDIACRMDNPRMGIVDVGYGTLPEARGRGVASTALTLLSAWLLDPLSGAEAGGAD